MRRREFIAGLGSAVAWPMAARAQQPERMRRLGALIGGDESDPDRRIRIAEFRRALQEKGWIEGRTIRIDWRWAAGDRDRALAYAAELVALKPDVLFGDNTFVVQQLQRATSTLPIVFAAVNNPILSRFVSSLARPGGNITGFTDSEPQSLAKLAEFMKAIAPWVTRVAIIEQRGPSQAGRTRLEGVATAMSSAGLRGTVVEVGSALEIESAIVQFGQEPNGGLIVPGDPLTVIHRKLIFALAVHEKLPAIGGYRWVTADGGLLSYGTKTIEQYRGAAGYIDRLLKDEKPGDLPVQLPTKFELVINLKTAKALGLTIPETLLATADEVIE
jgi:putative ABC transport system substrate-binding protein